MTKIQIHSVSYYGFELISSLIFALAIKKITSNSANVGMAVILGFVSILILLHMAQLYFSKRIIALKCGYDTATKMALYERILSASYLPLTELGYAAVQTRLDQDFTKASAMKVYFYPKLVVGMICNLIYLSLMGLENLTLTLDCFLLALCTLFLPLLLKDKFAINYETYIERWEQSHEHIVGTIKGFASMMCFNSQLWFQTENKKRLDQLQETAHQMDTLSALETGFKESTVSMLKMLFVGITTAFFGSGKITFSSVAIIIFFGFKIFNGFFEIYQQYYLILDAQIADKRLLQLQMLPIDRPRESSKGHQWQFPLLIPNQAIAIGQKSLVLPGFTIQEGSKVAMVGSNGSGKSTLLRVLSGLLQTREMQDKLEDVVYMPQRGTTPYLTPRHEYSLILDQCINTENMLYTALGIEELLDKLYTTMSGGEFQRVYLFFSVAMKGRLYLLDEPTNHLDRESVDCFVQWLKRTNKSLVVVSHDDKILTCLSQKIELEGKVITNVVA